MFVVGGGGDVAVVENAELELEQHMIEGSIPASIPLLKISLGSCN